MKIKSKISLFMALMILVVLGLQAALMLFSIHRFRAYGDTMMGSINQSVDSSVRTRLTELADDISHYVVTIEAEIDKNMLTAAHYLAAMDAARGGKMTQAELERIKRETGMSDLYLGDRNGVFTLSTEPASIGMSLFDVWDGYRALVTGASTYMPSDLKRKEETGETFKFTAIPRLGGRGVLESALNADSIEQYMQEFVSAGNGIRSMNLFDATGLTLTLNTADGEAGDYQKGETALASEIAALFSDPTQISLTINNKDGKIYYPVMAAGKIRYVLYIHLDTTSYFAIEDMIEKPFGRLIDENRRLNIISCAAVFVLLLVFTVFIAFFVGKQLSPLAFFNKVLAAFASGNFAQALPDKIKKRHDEMGDMARSFAATMTEMQGLITVIKQQAAELAHTGDELVSNMSTTATAVTQIAGHVQGIKAQIGTQAASVTETSGNMEQSMALIEDLNGRIDVQFERVSSSLASVEEMQASINSIVATLGKNAASIKTLADSAEVGKSDLQNVVADIQEIARQSEGLLEINAVIDNIASQTNLLSMNAAIEAAHAGESGKGFAVVADEIRKLAEDSSEQAQTTAAMLKKIKASIDEITRSTDVVLRRFEDIDSEVQTVAAQEQSIRTSMTEQEQGSAHVLDAMTQIKTISDDIQKKSAQIAAQSQDVLNASESLKSATAEIEDRMNEIASGTSQIESTVTRVRSMSADNKHHIDTLSDKMDSFKVEDDGAV